MPSVKYPFASTKLEGEDGNAFFILGKLQQRLKKTGVLSDEQIKAEIDELTSGSYNQLLCGVMDLVVCDPDEDEQYQIEKRLEDLKDFLNENDLSHYDEESCRELVELWKKEMA